MSTDDRLTAEQIDVFDEVLGHLIKRMEARALAELSERLAPIQTAPIGVIRSLAHDDEIAVAGPVLTLSDRLSSNDLVEIARSKGQAHLLAISGRKTLESSVTDVLVERGNHDVRHKLAASAGAQFSAEGMARMVKHAEADDSLTERLGLRIDLPLHLLRQLLSKASEIVRDKLLAMAPAQHREDIQSILSGIGDDVIGNLAAAPDFEHANFIVKRMHENKELDEIALLQFAKSDQYAETVAALALMCSAPHDLLDRIFQSGRTEAFLVPCRAAGLSWPTTRAILQTKKTGISDQTLNDLKADYGRLSMTTAQRVIRFWCVQKAAGKDGFSG